MDILKKLRNGNVDFLKHFTMEDKYQTFELISNSQDCDTILRTILPIFRNCDNWYGMSNYIFQLIYLKKEFEEDAKYLLDKKYIKPEEIYLFDITQILENTSWGLDYIYDNLEKLHHTVIGKLIVYLKDKPEVYLRFLDRIFSIPDQKVRDLFLMKSIMRKVPFDKKNIVRSFCQHPLDFDKGQRYSEKSLLNPSTLPKFLLFYALKDPELEQVMIEYFEIFFQVESEERMRLLDSFLDKISIDFLNEYKELLKLYQYQKTIDIDRKLTILSKYNQELAITDFLRGKETSYIKSGTTTSVFKVGDQVLKLSLQKHDPNTERNFFLIAPTELQIVCDKEKMPLLYIEKQPYLSKFHNGTKMNEEDIRKFFEGLDNYGLEVTDPHCVSGCFDNFGFLNDYHEADITGFSSHEELPEWFKQRPIVLYDVDLIYRKGSEKKITFPSCWS